MSKKRHYVHGEVNFFEMEIPVGAVRINPTEAQLCAAGFIVGESETTGNHHCVEANPAKAEFYELDGVTYIRTLGEPEVKAANGPKVNCLHKGRHDEMTLPSGTSFKRNISKEFDYVEMSKRNVAD